ncbi:allatostatin-A receptor-like [Argiope bruennichi]|uniref:Allatostatin-A receptor like protein n=1 Tax=Argiope bruennichi TaxID=94029 RepID=A0A8T0E448_ARGBR|nr:allatostatin-A receptor-like [Argiope bruennichi]KAF8766553.1 Allatostatin-A receptor like protein [Argiope bruennichi]
MNGNEYLDIDAEIQETPPMVEFEDISDILNSNLSLKSQAGILCNSSLLSNGTDCGNMSDYDYGRHDYSDAFAMEHILSIVVPILFGVIVVVGLFGNALVVIVVTCNPQMRSTTNLLIINLAMADLLFIVFCVPFTAWDYALPYWPFGDAWCRIVQYLVIVCAYASIYTLVLMSLDRFLAVVHPVTSMSIRTEKNAYIAIGLMWVVILLSCIPALQSHGEMFYMFAYTEYSVCVFLATMGYNYAAFQICFFLSSYIIPLGLIFCLYMLMLKRLWFGVAPGGHMSAESVKSKKRVTRMVVVVVVIFAFCWCPIQIVLVLKSVSAFELNPANIVIQITSHILAYMNSCVNPILYAFLSDNFRKAFRKVIYCNSRYNRPQRTTHERNDRETGTCATKTTKVVNDIV